MKNILLALALVLVGSATAVAVDKPTDNMLIHLRDIRARDANRLRDIAAIMDHSNPPPTMSELSWKRIAIGLRLFASRPLDTQLEEAAVMLIYFQDDHTTRSPAWALLPSAEMPDSYWAEAEPEYVVQTLRALHKVKLGHDPDNDVRR